MSTPTTASDGALATVRHQAIADLFLQGRRISEVVARGLTASPSWRKPDVIALLNARGWALDSDGRIPRRHRTSDVPPATALPGQVPPDPPRRPVAEFPPLGTVTEGPRAATPAAQMIATGKAHPTPAIQRLAAKADTAVRALAEALRADEDNARVRARLAEVEAEAARLRAQLRRPTRSPAAVPAGGAGKPINHGTWGGWQAEKARGLPHCRPCDAAKDEHMASIRPQRQGGDA